MKLCSRCSIRESGYNKNLICRECLREQNKKYYEENRDKVIQQVSEYRSNNLEAVRAISNAANKARYHALKPQAFDKLGNRCACCGETNPKFLTIDHVKNDGAEHRKKIGSSFKIFLAVLDDTDNRFQILCWNCNCGRALNNGICPHKDPEGSTTIPTGSTPKQAEARSTGNGEDIV